MPVSIMVDGVPFFFLLNSTGYYVGAFGQRVDINGSPVIVTFDTPIVPGGNPPTIDAGEAYAKIKAALGE